MAGGNKLSLQVRNVVQFKAEVKFVLISKINTIYIYELD